MKNSEIRKILPSLASYADLVVKANRINIEILLKDYAIRSRRLLLGRQRRRML